MNTFLLSPLGKGVSILLIIAAAYLGFRAWLSAHDANVLSGYVLLSEKTALQAQLDEVTRQRSAAAQSLEEFRKRAAADAALDQKTETEREQERMAYEIRLSQANRRCAIGAADLEFLQRHKSN